MKTSIVEEIKNGKKIRIFVLVNTLTSVNSFSYSSHIQFFTYHAKQFPNIEIAFLPPNRMGIDAARNMAAEYALRLECDYLLFLDDDVMIPRDSLIRLIEADKDICAGLVIIRGVPFNVMAFKYGKKRKNQRDIGFFNDLPLDDSGKLKPGAQKLQKCDAVGFSLCLIKTDVLKRISQPYFLTGTGHTEDVYFCLKAKEEEKIQTWMDISIQCGHLLNQEPVAWYNRKHLLKYYETVLPKEKIDKGREKDYFSRNLALLK